MAWGVWDYPEPSLKYQRDHDGGYEWEDHELDGDCDEEYEAEEDELFED